MLRRRQALTLTHAMRHSHDYTYSCKSFSAFCQLVISFFFSASPRFVGSWRYFRSLWLICSARAQTCSHAIWIMVVRLSTRIYVQTIYSLTECLNYKFFGRSFLFLPFLLSGSFRFLVWETETNTAGLLFYWKHLPWFLFQYRVTKFGYTKKSCFTSYTDSPTSFPVASYRPSISDFMVADTECG